jgi:uncharacterized membrane protein YfcA
MQEIVLLVAGAFAGAFVSGLTGFGTGLTALVFWLYAVPPVVAGPLVAACSVVTQVQSLPLVWHALDWRRIAPFVAGGLVGIPVGTALLVHTPVGLLKLVLGVLLIVYSGVMLLGRLRPTIMRQRRWADAIVGLGGGVLGGLAGLSGVLPTIWASLQDWGKDERRAVFQGFNLTILSLTVATHALAGLLTDAFFRALLVCLPGTILGAIAGNWVYRRVSGETFNRIVLSVLMLAGVMLVLSNVGAMSTR